MIKKYFLLPLAVLVMHCSSDNKINIHDCAIYMDNDAKFQTIEERLLIDLEDSLATKEFETSVRNHIYYIKDLMNKWESEYSSTYSDLIIKAFNDEYVLIYCPRSGIIEGYKLFPNRYHDVYLIRRNDGKNVQRIVLDKGLAGAVIFDSSIFLKFLDPDQIRRCDL